LVSPCCLFPALVFRLRVALDEVARDGLERIGLLQLLCLEDGVVSFRDLNECIARLLAGLGEGELRAKGEALLSRAATAEAVHQDQALLSFFGDAQTETGQRGVPDFQAAIAGWL
jgi:hypothetical protein